MKIALILLVQLASFSIQAQWLQDPTQYGKPLMVKPGLVIEGSPYLLADWKSGFATLTKGGKFRVAKMKYNILTEQIEFQNGGRDLFLDATSFSSFGIVDAGDTLFFRNQIDNFDLYPTLAYAEVMYEGKNLWISKRLKILIDDPNAVYGSTKRKFIKEEEFFFMIPSSGKPLKFKMTVKSIAKIVSIEAGSFEEFLKEKGYSLEDRRKHREIFSWIESQVSN